MTVLSKPEVQGATNTRRKIVPPISLARPEKKEPKRSECQTYKLRNVPTDANSPTYEVSVPYFSTGSCEEWLIFRKNLEKVLTGQNVTGGPQKFVVARRLLDGEALTNFENEAKKQTTAQGNVSETGATFTACLDAVARNVFPKRAVLLQKRYMRRFVRKPMEMKTRDYVARLSELNSYLPSFPPVTAGGSAPEKLPDDEIVDLLEFGVPNAWQREMIIQDFDPLQHTIAEFVEFGERMEQVESTDGGQKDRNRKNGKRARGSDGPAAKKGGKADKADGYYCLLHGHNKTHGSDDCHALKGQAKRMKQTYEAQAPDKKKAYKKKQELNALIADAVDSAIKKANRPKRKAPKYSEELRAFSKMSLSDGSEKDAGNESDSSDE